MSFVKGMTLRKQQLLRLMAGVIALLIAVFVTVFIRDALSQRTPENTLPVMDVYYNGYDAGDRLPAAAIKQDKYSWQYLFWTRSGGGLDLEAWRSIEPAFVNPGSPIDLAFTFQPKDIKVSMAAGESDFVEVGGQLMAPKTPGRYAYKVEASWGANRNVVYYFRIEVPWAA